MVGVDGTLLSAVTELLVLLETVLSMSFGGEVCRVSTGKAVEEPCREAREVEKASRVKCAMAVT